MHAAVAAKGGWLRPARAVQQGRRPSILPATATTVTWPQRARLGTARGSAPPRVTSGKPWHLPQLLLLLLILTPRFREALSQLGGGFLIPSLCLRSTLRSSCQLRSSGRRGRRQPLPSSAVTPAWLLPFCMVCLLTLAARQATVVGLEVATACIPPLPVPIQAGAGVYLPPAATAETICKWRWQEWAAGRIPACRCVDSNGKQPWQRQR